MNLPTEIFLTPEKHLPITDYVAWKVKQLDARFKDDGVFFTETDIHKYLDMCAEDEEFPEDTESYEFAALESCCCDLTRSNEITQSLYDKTVAKAIDSIPKMELIMEPSIPSAANSALPESINAPIILAESQQPQEQQIEVLEPSKSTDEQILICARESRLDNSYSSIREKFDFSPDWTHCQSKPGAIIAPQDWAAVFGMAYDMGKRSAWLMGEAVNALLVLGKEHAVEAIADEFGFSYAHASNWARICRRISPELRDNLTPTVAQELATRSYDQDEGKNTEIITELVKQAKDQKWNSAQARSHAMKAQGKDAPIVDWSGGKKALKERIEVLESFMSDALALISGISTYSASPTVNKMAQEWCEKTQKFLGVTPTQTEAA